MKRGEMFRNIFQLANEGKTAQEIIDTGYPKSTVYWAIGKMKEGKTPTLVKPTPGIRAYNLTGAVHTCPDGRTGFIERDEIWTDEGIIFRDVCLVCLMVIKTEFSEWVPEAKERYQMFRAKGYTGFDALANMKQSNTSLLRLRM